MPQQTSLKIFAVCLGVASLGLQIILLRQFMTIYYGNELIIGIVLALWLLWIGLGSHLGHVLWSKKSPRFSLFTTTLFFGFVASIVVYMSTKFVRLFFHVPYGEFLSFSEIIVFAGLALFAPAFIFGFSYALLVRLHSNTSAKEQSPASIYAHEALGSVIIGILFTFFFADIADLVALFIITFSALVVSFIVTRYKSLLAPIFLTLFLLVPPIPHLIETWLLQHYWSTVDENFELKDWHITRFGQSSVIEWGGEKYLYHNGIKVSSLQSNVDNQALAATLMVQHPHPQKLLIIEGNTGGLALECARFPVVVDAMELDKAMFQFARTHMDSSRNERWDRNNIRLHFTDARRALERAQGRWDMIVLNVGPPSTALSNRYYTRSFFQLVRNILTENGVLAICHFPAGENFLGDELLSLNKILLNTLKSEFGETVALPGDEAIFFAAKNKKALTTYTAEL